MLTFPNAKINLGLNIVEKRSDGFHNIESCFYPLAFCEALEIIPSSHLQFSSSGLDIPGQATHNLCLKAYHLLVQDYSIAPVHMHLHKVLPIGAGLGGGSADAAYALKMLNELFKLNISQQRLEHYARQLGSDCAFFIENKAKYCHQKGDEFEDISVDLKGYYFVLLYPNLHISTAEAYAGVIPQPSADAIKTRLAQPIHTWATHLKNDFEQSLFPKYPILAQIKEQLYAQGALYASMSGSGSSIYGIFNSQIELTRYAEYVVYQAKIV